MRISVFGLGYVGTVTAACLARDGHHVVGVDVNRHKVAVVRDGASPILEPGLSEMVRDAVAAGNLTATCDAVAAVEGTEVSLVCVGTPSNPNGSLDLSSVEHVARQIGSALAAGERYHVVAVRSTVLPGTVEERLVPILEEHSGKVAGEDFGVCMVPEFLREGSAVRDFDNPSVIVVGQLDGRSGDVLEGVFGTAQAPLVRPALRTAEMVKYVSNAFHALKVAFANEIGTFCKGQGIDGREVMDIFCQDRQLNISPAYLKPGFAFGGSCLPKDLRALVYSAKEQDIEAPLLRATLESNELHIRRGISLVERAGRHRVGVLGLSFKQGTDDVRESPVVPLVETLVGRGYDVHVFDETVQLGSLIGANKAFLDEQIPHIACLMCASVDELVAQSDTLVIANGGAASIDLARLTTDHQVVIDLVGARGVRAEREGYEGICW